MESRIEYFPDGTEHEPRPGVDGIVYPVKSFGGISIADSSSASWEVGPRGLRYDRAWMVITPDGTFLTQREIPPFALIRPQLTDTHLILRAHNSAVADFHLPLNVEGPSMDTRIWRDEGVQGIDQGPEVAEWIRTFVGDFVSQNPGCLPKNFALPDKLKLVRMADDHIRQVDQAWAPRETDQVGYADGFSLLLISEGSLAELNRRLREQGNESVGMNRFRPNLVTSHNEAHIEDTWEIIRIGEVVFDVAKPCARCQIVTTNQDAGWVDRPDVLTTLAQYRNAKQLGVAGVNGVLFGQNLVHRNEGIIRASDQIEVLKYR